MATFCLEVIPWQPQARTEKLGENIGTWCEPPFIYIYFKIDFVVLIFYPLLRLEH